MNGFMASLLAFAHAMIAGMVTVHVLLTHRQVRSSAGWIGLAWLSPLVGSMIYVAFGINRVARRASRIRLRSPRTPELAPPAPKAPAIKLRPANIAKIARASGDIADLPLTEGNSLKVLVNGDEAYPAMLETIASAKSTIALSSYIFEADRAGTAFIEALIAARGRGVEVRIMLDGIGGGYFHSAATNALGAGGVTVVRFLHEWLPWDMSFINLRNHKKLLVVDGRIGFTGGMNIADDNVGGEGVPIVRDLHVRLEGPIVRHLLQTFATDWEFSTYEPLHGPGWWPPIEPAGTIPMRGIASGPDESVGRIGSLFATAIEQAEKKVRIVTPYFLPEDSLLDVLARAAQRGVRVEVIIPQRSNHFYFDWAMMAHLDRPEIERLNIHQTPPPFDHTKLMSVDGSWCAVGSPNWDARSMRLNFEFLVECYGTIVTAQIDKVIDAKLAASTLLSTETLAHRALPVRLRDASARLLLPYL